MKIVSEKLAQDQFTQLKLKNLASAVFCFSTSPPLYRRIDERLSLKLSNAALHA
ncbi:TPA: hypothetical protein ACKRWD_001191 [Proteus mirabilis]|nr:hypothetical protein [Proteus mirabilis]